MLIKYNYLIRKIYLLFILHLLIILSGCSKINDDLIIKNNLISNYKNIPGITNEEIKQIEVLKNEKKKIIFGTLKSDEIFSNRDQTNNGFIKQICGLFSYIFDIPFITEYYDWETLENEVLCENVDFTDIMTNNLYENNRIISTHPISEHSLSIYELENSKRIDDESDLNGLKIGFLKNSMTNEFVTNIYPFLKIETVDFNNFDEAIIKLKSKEIDAFIAESIYYYKFIEYDYLISKEIFELINFPVSISTLKPNLYFIINLVNKYIESGGISVINDLYLHEETQYFRFALNKTLSNDEKNYLKLIKKSNYKVPISLEYDNYPISFYNSREKKFQGVAIDILSEISKYTDIEFNIINDYKTPWVKIYNDLKNGNASLVSELIYSEERKDNFLFSVPYFSSNYALLSKINYPYLKIYQVSYSKVGVVKDSAYSDIYNSMFTNVTNLHYYDTLYDAIKALDKDEINLLMASENTLLAMRNYLEMPGYKVNIGFKTPIEESHFGFNLSENILWSIFNKTQKFVNIDRIGSNWKSLIFDYSRKLTLVRYRYISMSAIFLLFLFIVTFVLFIRNTKTRQLYKDQMIKLSAIYNSLPDLVYSKNINGEFTSCNKNYELFFGVKEEDIIGKTVINVQNDKEQGKRLFEMDKMVLTENKTLVTEECYLYPNNEKRLFENTKVPLLSDGKVVGLIGIDRDVTEHKNAITAAYEASRAKSNFLARMSHEIRTPMNAIIGMTELALREKEANQIQKHIMTVKQAGAHLLSIINDILNFSKIERGKLEIIPGDYLFSSLVNDVISIIRMRLIDSQIRFAVNIDSLIPNELNGDETRMRQILLNILSNAVKYTEKGFITFTVHFEETDEMTINLIMEVMDSGKGIKKENLDNLFDEYIQVDQERNRGIEGIGLGLSITWSLVKAMGGDIKVYSEYGKGSIFTIVVPQKKRSEKNLAKIINPELKNAIIYERREIYANSIIYSIENLKVKCVLVEKDTELLDELKKKEYNFLFISYFLLKRNNDIIKKFGDNIKIVVLTEFGEAIPDLTLNIISMPVYSISIANILNGVTDYFNYNENDENVIRFIAPSAKILIVDDINTNLKVAEGLMLPYKMKIDLCKSGKEAIEAVSSKEYDIIFMDHKMPEMDGIETTMHIRGMTGNDLYYKNIPIIALTANAISEVKEDFLKKGFTDFLAKPIDMLKLNVILEKWLPKNKREIVVKSNEKIKNEENVFGYEIDGVNVINGVNISGGTIEKYLEILEIFCSDSNKKINELNQFLQSDNFNMYIIYIHAMKSALANIGATELSNEAKMLENMGEHKNYEFIKLNHNSFIEKLKIIITDIENILEKNRVKDYIISENNLKLIKVLFDNLLNALNNYEAGNINKNINELVEITKYSNFEERIKNLSELILMGEYEQAADIIKDLYKEDLL